MRVAQVVAVAANGVIGRDGALPWHLPEDLKWFKRVTLGHPIIMGRVTFDSIGRPLPGRTNIVVTRDGAWTAEGVRVAHDVAAALALAAAEGAAEAMVIGGATIYAQTLDRTDRLYLTEVHATVDGDTRFPPLDRAQWTEVSREDHPADGDRPGYSFVVLDRKAE
ncbi:MAG: dihydrofolate reductase [Rhodobacterales bacterium]|nr:dihydrofolate reductase [Rhodobacterales bacterium]